jgi:endo-1,4-beta-xylanase
LDRRRFLKYAGATAVVGLSALWIDYFLKLRNQTDLVQPSTTKIGAASVSVTSVTASPVYYTTNPSSLRAVAENDALLVGAAVIPSYLSEKSNGAMKYANTLANEFNFLTPENAMKWRPIDQSGFGPADNLVDFASQNKMKVKGHTLVWHNQLPDWVNAQMSSDELRAAVQDHIISVVGHFKGRVFAWDVVNEAVDDKSGLRNSIFLQKLGDGYIAEAFRLAHETDPDAFLTYNDYGAEGSGGKSDRVYDLVRKLLADGVPIHGVGLQMHIKASDYPTPSSIAANIRRLASLGLKVNISEMDVRISDIQGDMTEKLKVQRQVYHDILAACLKEKGFMAVTFWGFTDAHSWIQSRYGPDNPLLFDQNYQAKPAYYGVFEALQGK